MNHINNQGEKSLNLSNISFVIKIIFAWLFGIQLAVTCTLGYYAYITNSIPISIGFVLAATSYIYGVQYTLHILLIVFTIECIIHKNKLNSFAKFIKTSYLNAKHMLKINEQLNRGEKDQDFNQDFNHDITMLNNSMMVMVKLTDLLVEKINNISNTVATSSIYNKLNESYDFVLKLIMMDNVKRTLELVDKLFGKLFEVTHMILEKMPIIGPKIIEAKKLKNQQEMVVDDSSMKVIDSDSIDNNESVSVESVSAESVSAESVSVESVSNDKDIDNVSNDKEEDCIPDELLKIIKTNDPKNNINYDLNDNIESDVNSKDLDSLLKQLPEPQTEKEKHMHEQLQKLSKLKPPNPKDMKNMNPMEMMQNLNSLMQIMGELNTIAEEVGIKNVENKKSK